MYCYLKHSYEHISCFHHFSGSKIFRTDIQPNIVGNSGNAE